MTTDDKSTNFPKLPDRIKIIRGRKQPHKRVGRYKNFKELYDLAVKKDRTILFEFAELPPDINEKLVWSVIESGNYKWYVVPGFRIANHTGYYLICKNARGEGNHNDYRFQ